MTIAHALIIDDNANNLEIFKMLLSSCDVTCSQVQLTATLPDVLATLDRLDVVFVDLEMPDSDGYQVLDYLRSTASITVPIIACTVHTNEMNHAQALGFDGFLSKPIQLDRFPNQLKRILNRESVWER